MFCTVGDATILRFRLWTLVGLSLLVSGCLNDFIRELIPVPTSDGGITVSDGAPGLDGNENAPLTLLNMKPSHGPFVGGTEAILSGTGFSADVQVSIDGKHLDNEHVTLLSPLGLKLVMPPSDKAKSVDIEVSTETQKATLPGGFAYDPVFLAPDRGPIVGGTLVTFYAKDAIFQGEMTLLLGGTPMTEVELVSGTMMRAYTPVGIEGPASLKITLSDGKSLIVDEAFQYYSSTNPLYGGLGGGPLEGTLTVSVLDTVTRNPIADATVIVQKDREIELVSTTNAQGVVVFAKSNLSGPVNVTGARQNYEASTLVQVSARDVTMFLTPIIPPEQGPGTISPGQQAPSVSGNLLFGGVTGAGSAAWDMIPTPRANELKRILIYTTTPSMSGEPSQPSASVDFDGSRDGTWPFMIYVRPGTFALYALAGIYQMDSGKFEPYTIGVTRGIVANPGDEVHADILINAPLTETIATKLVDVPQGVQRYTVRLAIDLGADGFIFPSYQLAKGDAIPSFVEFGRLPRFNTQGLIDAAYSVHVTLQHSGPTGVPIVRAVERGVQPVNNQIEVAGFIGVPQQVKPSFGAMLEGNTLKWTHPGAASDLAVTVLRRPDEIPVWRVISHGAVKEVRLPDPETFHLPCWPGGPLIWQQWQAKLVDGWDFSVFNYSDIVASTWRRSAYNEFLLHIPELTTTTPTCVTP